MSEKILVSWFILLKLFNIEHSFQVSSSKYSFKEKHCSIFQHTYIFFASYFSLNIFTYLCFINDTLKKISEHNQTILMGLLPPINTRVLCLSPVSQALFTIAVLYTDKSSSSILYRYFDCTWSYTPPWAFQVQRLFPT